jgi:hypothetical protein
MTGIWGFCVIANTHQGATKSGKNFLAIHFSVIALLEELFCP